MSKLKVIRASAGSGKTYCITSDYLHLLFKNPESYKHILAVTFTNKATEEMKNRILGELFDIASGLPSIRIETIAKEFNLTSKQAGEKAQNILNNILHNYSRFNICTIDSFFQRIIKSFARETGLQFNFEVELDINDVIENAADNLLLRIEYDITQLNWLVQFAEERIEEGKSWNFRHEILNLGKQLFNEEFKSLPVSFHQRLTNKEWLKGFQKQLYEIRKSFETKMQNAGIEGMAILSKYGLTIDDFKYGKQGGVGHYIYKLSLGSNSIPSQRILDAAGSIDNWLPKGKEESIKIQAAADNGLYELLKKTISFFNDNITMYNSCTSVLSNFYSLGILANLSESINNYSTVKNIFILSNANNFLKSIIGENDAPFVYEKTGQTFDNFMIDEFQDTSGVQWHNFKPLILNSLSENNECMVVGDIKQSIYRWRNTDWKIMAEQLETDLAGHGIKVEDLKTNWRSKFNIVAFNNTFFSKSPVTLQQYFNAEIADKNFNKTESDYLNKLIIKAYEGCRQKLPANYTKDEGYISINFIKNENKDWKETALNLLPGIINKIIKQGYRQKDIAVLVRTAKEGHEVVDYINSYRNTNSGANQISFQAISNESAFIKNSFAVNFIIKIFKYFVFPDDEINLKSVIYDYRVIFKNENSNNIDDNKIFDSEVQELIKDLPSEFVQKIDQFRYQSPDLLFEQMIRIFNLSSHISELPFLQAFQDCILDYLKSNPNSLPDFLEYWEDKKDKFSVSVSEEQDAIKVMTVHKSKGLEFDNVIIPFCNWELDQKKQNAPFIWCSTQTFPLSQLEFMPLKYSSGLQDTFFSTYYFHEKAQNLVDNLNLLYVAFTRAADNLFICAPLPGNNEKLSIVADLLFKVLCKNENSESNEYPFLNFTDGLNIENNIFESGKIPICSAKEGSKNFPVLLDEFPVIELKEKLHQKYFFPDFWDTDNDQRLSGRAYGNIMHRLFQQIITFDDIENAVNSMITSGFVKEREKDLLIEEVKNLILKEPVNEWFSGNWKVMNEAGIIVPNQHLYRPDRVMVKENIAVIIDYKFGQVKDTRYNLQVEKYSGYLKIMGYRQVEGFIWYVNLDSLERVV